MEIFGVGLLEILLVVLIALLVLGPKDLKKTGLTIGRFMRQVVSSPTWHTLQKTSLELRRLPTYLMREAGLEETPNTPPAPDSPKISLRTDSPPSPASARPDPKPPASAALTPDEDFIDPTPGAPAG